jgi:hypothetical protein
MRKIYLWRRFMGMRHGGRTQFDILIGKARIIVLPAHIIHCALSAGKEK